ncbi:GntR family transcriptional regulator [Frigidibacter oleivorans]|uniref:GntR family transcriptional regulator n=1 Tax=Frigidibacter oleivorans TaxID=2487129 RepID=UPI000F8E433B|nr:FCD domain-containing protein [Frigidibacter oleivorans]
MTTVHKSLTARTCDRLRMAVIESRYAPGERLRIEEICRDLQASSGAVREALSRLTAEGLVIAEPQRGFVVAPISRRDLTDLTEVRIDIELRCLHQSILHGDMEWEAAIIAARHRLGSLRNAFLTPGAPEAQTWHQLHAAFHDALAAACPNRWWLRLRQQLYVQSERYRRLSGPADETGRDVHAEHEALAEAVVGRDAARAETLMRDHLTRTTDILLGSRMPFAEDAEARSPA